MLQIPTEKLKVLRFGLESIDLVRSLQASRKNDRSIADIRTDIQQISSLE